MPVTPEERAAPRAEPFEISQEAGTRPEEEAEQAQEASEEEQEQEQARIQADLTAIEGIRRAEVRLACLFRQSSTSVTCAYEVLHVQECCNSVLTSL